MTGDLKEALSATQESLADIGIDDALVREVLSYRLLIERLGETDNNGWWESIVLTETGRARLDEVAPKTATKARIDLAQKVGRKAEQDRLESDSISLFYLGPSVEAQISAELEGLVSGSEFGQLETVTTIIDEPEWTARLVNPPEYGFKENKETIQIGSEPLDESKLKSRSTIRDAARVCFAEYGRSTERELRVPYYEINL